MIKLVKVKPYGQGQGPFVLMEEQDFDPKKFTLYDPVAEAAAKAAQEAEAKRLADEAAKAKQAPAPAGKK